MRARTALFACFLPAFAMLASCNLLKKKDAQDAAPEAAATATAEPTATADDATDAAPDATSKLDPEWIPGSADEEAKAKKEISVGTYKKELDALDQEITAASTGAAPGTKK